MIWLDLDRFKQVNDLLGHIARDSILCEVTHRLSASLRESDTVARVGGDEFMVLIGGVTCDAGVDMLRFRN